LLQQELLKEILTSNVLIYTEEQNFENWLNAVKYLVKALWNNTVEVYTTDGCAVDGTGGKIAAEKFFERVELGEEGGFVVLTDVNFWRRGEEEVKKTLKVMENLCSISHGRGFGVVFVCPFAAAEKYMQKFSNVHVFVNSPF
jgi:hypothetical protein